MNITRLLQEGTRRLADNGVEEAAVDARLLLGHCLQKSRTELYLHGARAVDSAAGNRFFEYIRRRSAREPVAYILGEQEFWSLPFQVNGNVLIPRPETEYLLESVLTRLSADKCSPECCLDLCCGSGVIAVVLARELAAQVTALDCSPEALRVAESNCRRHDVNGVVRLLASDLFTALSPAARFPLIVSNPPYVATGAIDGDLQPEVAENEPHLALDGGEDGLSLIRRIAAGALVHLAPGGMLFMEFGSDQAETVATLFQEASFKERFFQQIEIYQDYSGRDRVLYGKANLYRE